MGQEFAPPPPKTVTNVQLPGSSPVAIPMTRFFVDLSTFTRLWSVHSAHRCHVCSQAVR